MQVEIDSVDSNKCVVNVNFLPQDVEAEATEIARQMQPKATVKGFRQGTAPLPIIRNFYRKQILREVSQRLIQKGASDSLREKKLKNITNPELLEEYRMTDTNKKDHLGKFNIDGSFTFAMSVELPPEIDVKNYLDVKVDGDIEDFDSWFEKKIFNEQSLYGDKGPSGDLAKVGDELIVDFCGFLGEEALDAVENQRLIIGSGMYMGDFEAAFVGKVPNEEFEVSVQFPDDYNEEPIRGKEVRFTCKVHEVNAIVPHELNDDFAQLLSHADLDQMMKDYKITWEKDVEEPARAALFSRIMEQVAESNPFDLPKPWVDAEIDKRIKQMGMGDLVNQPDAINALRGLCENSVRYAYLLDKIYEKETSIHLGSEEFLELANEEAKKVEITGTELIEKLKREGSYEAFVSFHEQRKAMNFLVDNVIESRSK